MLRTLLSAALCALAVSLPARAGDADEIQAELEKAKIAHAEAGGKAKAGLLKMFDDAVKAVAQTGDLDAVKALRAERQVFDETGKLPQSARMEAGAGEYRRAAQKNKAALEKAYDVAVKASAKALKTEQADTIKAEWKAVQSGKAVVAKAKDPAPPKPAAPKDPDPAVVKPPARPAPKEDLKKLLADSEWEWRDGTTFKLKADGYAEHRRWDELGFVTRWEVIDRRTVLFAVEKGRNNDLYGVLRFAEDLKSYTGYAFDEKDRIEPRKRLR